MLGVEPVPGEPESAVAPERPSDLGQRRRVIEPMERLTTGHRVDALIAKRNLFGAADECLDVRQDPSQLTKHLRRRLHRDDVVPELDQRPRQLAGAGAEVEDTQRAIADEPANGFSRIARARSLVDGRLRAEGSRPSGPELVAQTRPLSERTASTYVRVSS